MPGGDFRISGLAAVRADRKPAIAFNTVSNQYLVVWEDDRNAPARGTDIYGQRIKASGLFAALDFRDVDPALAALREGAATDRNLIPLMLDAVRAYATIGEVCQALVPVFGTYREVSVI